MPAHLLKTSHTGLAGLIGLTCLLGAQTDPRPRFDVTSVKPHPQGARPTVNLHPGSLTFGGISVRAAMYLAYHVRPFQVIGGPSWLETDRFDFAGTTDGDHKADPSPDERKRLMETFQTLLEDRFQLKLRHETRTMPLYNLTVAKTGFKLKEGDDLPANAPGARMSPLGARIVRRTSTMADFADALTFNLETMVVDRTGLNGHFSFALEWRNDEPAVGIARDAVPGTVAAALRDQLGLNLEPAKGPVEVLIMESAQKPKEN